MKRIEKHRKAAEAKRLAAAAKRLRDEKADESIAPRAQRLPVLGRDGLPIRGARLERDGISFRVSNPIRRLVAISRNKPPGERLLDRRHEEAADRFVNAWTEGAGGVSIHIAKYGQTTSGNPQTGVITDGVIASVHRQVAARKEIDAVRRHLDTLWPVIYNTLIVGLDVAQWAEIAGLGQQQASGWLAAACDMLVSFYARSNAPQRIRGVGVRSREPEAEPEPEPQAEAAD